MRGRLEYDLSSLYRLCQVRIIQPVCVSVKYRHFFVKCRWQRLGEKWRWIKLSSFHPLCQIRVIQPVCVFVKCDFFVKWRYFTRYAGYESYCDIQQLTMFLWNVFQHAMPGTSHTAAVYIFAASELFKGRCINLLWSQTELLPSTALLIAPRHTKLVCFPTKDCLEGGKFALSIHEIRDDA